MITRILCAPPPDIFTIPKLLCNTSLAMLVSFLLLPPIAAYQRENIVGLPSETPRPIERKLGSDLRKAWILHRLEKQTLTAGQLYQRIFLHENLNSHGTNQRAKIASIRARAAIGLGLIETEEGRFPSALNWFERAANIEGVGIRWRTEARLLASRVRHHTEGPILKGLIIQVNDRQKEIAELREKFNARAVVLREASIFLENLDKTNGAENERNASELMAAMIDDERELHRLRQSAIHTNVNRARLSFQAGDFNKCLLALHKVLELDRDHAEALQLQTSCLAVLQASQLPQNSDGEVKALKLQLQAARKQVLVAMEGHYESGISAKLAGRLAEAIDHFQEVIQWYAWSPVQEDPQAMRLVELADEALNSSLIPDTFSQPVEGGVEAISLLQRGKILEREQRKIAVQVSGQYENFERVAQRIWAAYKDDQIKLQEWSTKKLKNVEQDWQALSVANDAKKTLINKPPEEGLMQKNLRLKNLRLEIETWKELCPWLENPSWIPPQG